MRALLETTSFAERFVGRLCLGAIPGDGSFLKLEFEPRRPRPIPLMSPHLTEEQRLGQAEYSIFVECAWRLDSAESVVCGGWDNDDPDGPKSNGLERIVGHRIKAVQVSEPGLDLDLRFENDLCLRIFSDQVNEIDENDNYSMSAPDRRLIIGLKSRLRWEKK